VTVWPPGDPNNGSVGVQRGNTCTFSSNFLQC